MSEQPSDQILTIDAALSLADSISSESARLDTELLLCHVLDCDRSYLRTWPERQLSPQHATRFQSLLQKRVEGFPIAYIVGYRDFWDLKLKVSKHTLIPRADTEVLVETALSLALPQNARVVDLGTGTGAIALALANERPNWSVFGLDRFEEVVALARENAELNDLSRVKFLTSDWFSTFSEEQTQGRFDLIVSNPPYIDKDDEHLVQGDVRFEPSSALVADNQGLADIELIAAQSLSFLNDNAWLVFEHGYDQGESVRDILGKHGFIDIQTQKDYGGNDRVSFGRINSKR